MRRLLNVAMVLLLLALPAAANEKPLPAGAMALGLAGVFDWSAQQPFLDVMKTSRPWIGHKRGEWGGEDIVSLRERGLLSEDGWPTRIPPDLRAIGTIVLNDIPAGATSVAGRYLVTFDGQGVLEASGRAQNVKYGRGQVSFDFTPGNGGVILDIKRTNKADPIRNVSVVLQDNADRFAAGEIFNPVWINRIAGFGTVRFMDWMDTNNSTQSTWENRPKTSDVTWSEKGVPIEIMVALANAHDFDPWFNMPHQATDAYIRNFAELVRDTLDPDLTVYVEYSNEVWNWQFEQTRWAEAKGLTRWGEKYSGWQYYGMRAAQMARLWREAYAADQADALVTVVSTQTGWLGREKDILEAPLWVAEDPENKAPAEAFDAYAVTGYFGGRIGHEDNADLTRGWLADSLAAAQKEAEARGLTGPDRDAFVWDNRFALAVRLAARELRTGEVSGDPRGSLSSLFNELFPHHRAVADRYGMDLVMYEGGTHVVGIGKVADDPDLAEFFIHLNYTPEMGQLYRELLAGWEASGGTLFNVFADVYKPSRWGSWGALRHLDDDNPRWEALTALNPGQ